MVVSRPSLHSVPNHAAQEARNENMPDNQRLNETISAEVERQLEERLRELEEEMSHNAVPRPQLIGDAEPWTFNVAICGNSGCGKSTAINTILNPLREDLQPQAAVGNQETTDRPTLFTLGCIKRLLRLAFRGDDQRQGWATRASQKVQRWLLTHGVEVAVGEHELVLNLVDHPGAGTPNHPARTYINDNGLIHYDFVVILTFPAWTESDNEVYRRCRENNIPVAIVRTRIDEDLRNENRKPKRSDDRKRKYCKSIGISLKRGTCGRSIFWTPWTSIHMISAFASVTLFG